MHPSPAPAELTPETVARLPERDPEALGIFFDVWFPRVYAFVRRLVGDEHLAEDLSQDIFVHVYRSIGSFDPARELRPWVFTIATNKVRDHWRSRRHRDSLLESSVEREGAAELLPVDASGPDEGLLREEMGERVRRSIDELPEGMRVTVILRVFEELSFEEIGRIVDRNEVAVRKRYSRALDTLRNTLGAAHRIHTEGT